METRYEEGNKMMSELVSIVIPIYNMSNSLIDCVKSIQNQDYQNIEIILVDDGSLDDSYSICCKIAENDKRIIPIHSNNQGSGPARNLGICKASGRYIFFPDADDFLEPNAISTMVNSMNNGEYDLAVFGFKQIDKKGNVLAIKKYEDSYQEGNDIRANYSDYLGYMSKWAIQGAPWNKLFDLRIIKEKNIFFPPLRRHQDEGFICRYMCFCKKVHFIENILYTYYVNDLKREWQKYPVNYIESVVGLYDIRKQTILKWNKDDLRTIEFIQKEYVFNFIKALELSFSPKMAFNSKKRKEWIKRQIYLYSFNSFILTASIDRYHKHAIDFIHKGKLRKLYRLLKTKVVIEKLGLLVFLKKIIYFLSAKKGEYNE